MFGLFGGSDSKVKIIDKVWMSKDAKWRACASMLELNPTCVFIAWFEETRNELAQVLGKEESVQLAEKIDYANLKDKMVVFAEHYPLPQREQALFKSLNLKEVPIASSLDEPLFMKFGGERTIEIMKNIGMKEDEVIGHSMITTSIRRAQEKLERNVKIEKLAVSSKEWFVLNIPH
ncbi:MAG TPA: hypothetical protein VGK39_00585 [Cyclobacteriaceae bacterium]